MFFKIVKGKCQSYLYLVQSYRDEAGKVKHRKICSFGAVKNLDSAFIKSFTQVTKYSATVELVDLESAIVSEKINYGASQVINYFWQYFAVGAFIKQSMRNSKLKIDIESVLKLLLSSRLLKPESKLQIYNHQKYYGAAKEIPLHKIYRTLDFLADHHEDIQKHLYRRQIEKDKMIVNVVFYDVTTFYFESVVQDDLKDFGFSKDCKINNTQVMFSILVNHQGMPIKFDIHKGNSYEGHTLVKALKAISTEYNIKQVILVADRGINNGENLLEIKNAGFDYIVGSKIKNMGDTIKKQILDLAGYEKIAPYDNEEGLGFKVINRDKTVKLQKGGEKETHKITGRLICTWSAKRAAKDKADRERMVERANSMLDNNSFTSTRGARKYLDITLSESPKLRTEKIIEDAKWDGFYGIETNNMNLSASEVAAAYHQLWVVEESFRILKHHFETRPMFHWTSNRIIGHLTLSYIAFLFERSLEIKLKTNGVEGVTHDRIREALSGMEVTVINNNSNRIQITNCNNDLTNAIMLTLSLEQPMNCKL